MNAIKKKAQSSLFPVRLTSNIKAALKLLKLDTIVFIGVALGIILATTIGAFS